MEYTSHDNVVFEMPVPIPKTVGQGVEYICTDSKSKSVLISVLTSPIRNPGVAWFQLDRLSRIISGFKNGEEVPPIKVHRHPESGRLVITDGFHRYYASIAAGFSRIPCREFQFFDADAD